MVPDPGGAAGDGLVHRADSAQDVHARRHEVVRSFDLGHLRHVASVGEPLNAEAVTWVQEAFGTPVLDTWWQTETGAIMVHNPVGVPTRPGAMGLALPGIEAAVLERSEDHVLVTDGRVREVATGVTGELALRAGWPSMFRGYLGDEERYRKRFVDGWYLTGDLVRRDD